eukprot:364169-Chlamydomonas_euryale.AAC.11
MSSTPHYQCAVLSNPCIQFHTPMPQLLAPACRCPVCRAVAPYAVPSPRVPSRHSQFESRAAISIQRAWRAKRASRPSRIADAIEELADAIGGDEYDSGGEDEQQRFGMNGMRCVVRHMLLRRVRRAFVLCGVCFCGACGVLLCCAVYAFAAHVGKQLCCWSA